MTITCIYRPFYTFWTKKHVSPVFVWVQSSAMSGPTTIGGSVTSAPAPVIVRLVNVTMFSTVAEKSTLVCFGCSKFASSSGRLLAIGRRPPNSSYFLFIGRDAMWTDNDSQRTINISVCSGLVSTLATVAIGFKIWEHRSRELIEIWSVI